MSILSTIFDILRTPLEFTDEEEVVETKTEEQKITSEKESNQEIDHWLTLYLDRPENCDPSQYPLQIVIRVPKYSVESEPTTIIDLQNYTDIVFDGLVKIDVEMFEGLDVDFMTATYLVMNHLRMLLPAQQELMSIPGPPKLIIDKNTLKPN